MQTKLILLLVLIASIELSGGVVPGEILGWKPKATEGNGKDTEPSSKDTEPNGEDTEPNGEDKEPNGEDKEPNGEDKGPNGEDTKPNGMHTEGNGRHVNDGGLLTELLDLNKLANFLLNLLGLGVSGLVEVGIPGFGDPGVIVLGAVNNILEVN